MLLNAFLTTSKWQDSKLAKRISFYLVGHPLVLAVSDRGVVQRYASKTAGARAPWWPTSVLTCKFPKVTRLRGHQSSQELISWGDREVSPEVMGLELSGDQLSPPKAERVVSLTYWKLVSKLAASQRDFVSVRNAHTLLLGGRLLKHTGLVKSG